MHVTVDVGSAQQPWTLTARDLSRSGWQLDPMRPAAASVVVAGRCMPASEIASVSVRDAAVRAEMLGWLDPDDRAYAAAEMGATLATWLALFPGPVDRRPRPPPGLGADDEPRPGRSLVVGASVDTPTLEVRSALYRRGCAPLVLDETNMSEFEPARRTHNGRIGNVQLSEVSRVYLRPDTCLGSAQYALLSWAQHMPGVVINRPVAMALNASKPMQLAEIAGYGFDVPSTLVTSSPDVARAFAAEHGRVIYKSASGVRSIATELEQTDAERLDAVEACPTMFQALVVGADVRVHVVGGQVFACEMEADRLDYRYAQRLVMRAVEIDPDLCQRIVEMVRAMGLHVAGVDLRRRVDGGWTCLEVNPSPAFSWFTERTHQPVAEAIAALLLREP